MSLDLYLRCACCDSCVADYNVTHNLTDMAEDAGIYNILWRPEENNIETAQDMIEPLKDGIDRLQSDPLRFKKLNPSNGWGDYDGFLQFCKQVLQSCEEYPRCKVFASR